LETDDLIESLVARHRPVDPAWIERRSTAVVAIGCAVAIASIWLTIGFRSDLMAALESGRIVTKYVFVLTALVMSGHLFTEMARPARRLADQVVVYAVPLGFIAIAALIQFAVMGQPTRATVLGDQANWLACLVIVPILAIVPFFGLMIVLRQCAPTDLAGAGFAAGVFAATIAATIYASHCPCDTPVFVGLWYSLAFLFSGAAGALLGSKVLRW
jgi:hypothetical protein